jgi:hypothetical protein
MFWGIGRGGGGGNEDGGVCRGVRFVVNASAFDLGVGWVDEREDGATTGLAV